MRIGYLRVLLLFALAFCLQPPPVFADGPLPVAVSIVPQRYFVEKIGGNLVEIEVMVPPGATPEQYEPKPRQMTALGRSRIYFTCGVPFEDTWLPRMLSANEKILVVYTEKDIRKRHMEGHVHGEAVKTAAGEHSHEEIDDPHIWLSPPLVMLQARAIFEALAGTDPNNRAVYEKNYKNFISELVDLDVYLSSLFAKAAKPGYFMVFHPAWGYFADAYGLRQVPVEVEGKEPKARELDDFIKRARDDGVKAIFVQPQYSPRTAQTIADAVGGKLVEGDDLAPDWDKNLRQVAGQIVAALGTKQDAEGGGK